MRVLAATLLAAVIAPAGATAGSALPQGASLEQVLGTVASQVAGTNVTVVCHPPEEWPMIVPGGTTMAAGYATPHRIDLSTQTCDRLRNYAEPIEKPTICDAFQIVKQRYRATVKKRVHGKIVKRKVWRTRTVQKVVAQVSCYTQPQGLTLERNTGSTGIPEAILVLAHEAIHVADFQAGVPVSEHHAQCAGLAAMPAVAVGLGGTAEDGSAMAVYYRDVVMPRMTGEYAVPC